MLDNVCVCCGKVIPEGRQVCRSCEISAQKMGLLSKPAVVTNADRIRAMSDEELAEFLDTATTCCADGDSCDKCPLRTINPQCNVITFEKWLKQECEENDET